jgi:hypothetical protein
MVLQFWFRGDSLANIYEKTADFSSLVIKQGF